MTSRTSRIVTARTTTRLSRGCNGRSGRPRRRPKGRALVQGAGPRRRKPCRRRLHRRRRSRSRRLTRLLAEDARVRKCQEGTSRPAAGAVAEAAAAAPIAESSDDGGLDDLQAIHTAPRSREKHSRSHSQGVARAMAIAKRNGQRSASRGGG